ncbi:hypothetical protein HU200_005684 [Digitaria exilis]|uniref:Uncharacterized protein n=1 Tax=Digitaria exilis TaxID=1010633 RepID=A0A835EUZ2_9POAL|nr:hypothetical protein HU200_022802 [Digitaria exilis]KAF8772510.1 hypothetical protein HU200_005684 [Digitaria exilis]
MSRRDRRETKRADERSEQSVTWTGRRRRVNQEGGPSPKVAEEAHVGLRLASSRGGVSRTHSVERPACASRKFPGGWDWRWREDVGGG